MSANTHSVRQALLQSAKVLIDSNSLSGAIDLLCQATRIPTQSPSKANAFEASTDSSEPELISVDDHLPPLTFVTEIECSDGSRLPLYRDSAALVLKTSDGVRHRGFLRQFRSGIAFVTEPGDPVRLRNVVGWVDAPPETSPESKQAGTIPD